MPKHGFCIHLVQMPETASLSQIWNQAKEVQKKLKCKTCAWSQHMWCSSYGKYQTMHTKVSGKNHSQTLVPCMTLLVFCTHLRRVHARSVANLLGMTVFLAEMWIFLWPSTLPTRVFCFSAQKWIFHFICAQGGQNEFIFMKWLPTISSTPPPLKFSLVVDLEG